MRRKRVIAQAFVALVLVWAVVAGVRALAGSKRVTADKLEQAIEDSGMADWSGVELRLVSDEAKARDKKLREIADMVNRLDFAEREETRERRIGEKFFRRLSVPERELFVELTIEKSMQTFMQALDALPPDERERFVEKGLREIEEGRTEEEMMRARELGADLLDRISEEGMKAYFEEASAETKLDLEPLMRAMDEVMKGLRGSEFGPPQR